MFVYAVKATHQDQLFGLTDVLWVNAKIHSLAIFDEIFGHYRRNDGEFIGEVNVAGPNFVNVDEIRPPFDGDEVHVEHLLFGDVVEPLHGLEGMENLVDFFVVDVKLLLYNTLDIIRIGVLSDQVLVVIQNQLIPETVFPLLLLLISILLVVFVDIVEFSKRIGDTDNFFIVAVGMAAIVVKTVLITIMVSLCPLALEAQLSLAIFALCHNLLDVAILFVGDQLKRVDPDLGIFSGVVFEHSLQNSNVFDLDVLCLFSGELEGTHASV